MKYGFIGLGTMAGAIIRGLAGSAAHRDDLLCGYNRSEGKTLALQKEVGLLPCKNAAQVVAESDVVVLAVKPQVMPTVLPEIHDAGIEKKLLVTIAAGLELSWYEDRLPKNTAVVRVMPNINAQVRAAYSALCAGTAVREGQIEIVEDLFRTVGKTCRLPESSLAAFTSISGSSGAFAFLYMDALADAGVRAGLSKDFALELAISATMGSAKLLEETKKHPAELCNMVCSPGGTTIEGVMTLKELGFESAVHEAVQAMIDKNNQLAK
jgi:pyrroline-5-carboxylate reductase